MSNVLKTGWMHFGEYCRLRGITQNGNHLRKLEKLDTQFKSNLSPTSSKITWAVKVNEADKLFIESEEES